MTKGPEDPPEKEESVNDWVEDLQSGISFANSLAHSLPKKEYARMYPEHEKLRGVRPQYIMLQGFMRYLMEERLMARINEFEIDRICGDFLGVDIVEYRQEHGEMVKTRTLPEGK